MSRFQQGSDSSIGWVRDAFVATFQMVHRQLCLFSPSSRIAKLSPFGERAANDLRPTIATGAASLPSGQDVRVGGGPEFVSGADKWRSLSSPNNNAVAAPAVPLKVRSSAISAVRHSLTTPSSPADANLSPFSEKASRLIGAAPPATRACTEP